MNNIKKREARRHKRHDKQVWRKEVEVEVRTSEVNKGISREVAEKETA
jgi:hypothetical protein